MAKYTLRYVDHREARLGRIIVRFIHGRIELMEDHGQQREFYAAVHIRSVNGQVIPTEHQYTLQNEDNEDEALVYGFRISAGIQPEDFELIEVL